MNQENLEQGFIRFIIIGLAFACLAPFLLGAWLYREATGAND